LTESVVSRRRSSTADPTLIRRDPTLISRDPTLILRDVTLALVIPITIDLHCTRPTGSGRPTSRSPTLGSE